MIALRQLLEGDSSCVYKGRTCLNYTLIGRIMGIVATLLAFRKDEKRCPLGWQMA